MNSTPLSTCLPSAAGAAVGELASRRRRSSLRTVTFATQTSISSTPIPLHGVSHQWNQVVELFSILWSFAAADLKTVVAPIALFGICSALGGEQLFEQTIPLADIVVRTPLALLWTWMCLVIHTISNQRSAESIAEDRINKPWRPIPSGRITADEARRLLLAIAPIVMATGAGMGVAQQTFLAIVSSWYYNDLGGADDSLLLRQLSNGVGYMAYQAAACRILAGAQTAFKPTFWVWLVLLAVMVATTIQVQDLKDEEGDRLNNRKTAPIVFGSHATRISVAVGVLFWTAFSLLWWNLELHDTVGPTMLVGLVAYRALRMCTPKADKKTFVIWVLWMTSLFALPALKNASVSRSLRMAA